MSSPAVKIEKVEISHAPAINALVNSAYRGQSSKKGWTTEADLLDGQRIDVERIKELIGNENSVILAAFSDKIIGCVHLEKILDDCYLGMLTVRPDIQAQGIGKKLLQASEHFALHTWNCKTISMSVISTRRELIEWYIRKGYQFTGSKKPFPMGDIRFGIPKVDKIEFEIYQKQLESN